LQKQILCQVQQLLCIIVLHVVLHNSHNCSHFWVYLTIIGEDDGTASVLGLCVRHADLLDRVSNSASSFGSPESRIGSPVESIDAWDSQL